MAINQKRKKRLALCIFLVVVFSILIGYFVLYKKCLFQKQYPVVGCVGFALLGALDVFIIKGILNMYGSRSSRKNRNRRKALYSESKTNQPDQKKSSSRTSVSLNKKMPSLESPAEAPSMPYEEKKTAKPISKDKAPAKKKPAMDQIDLNIRPFEEKDFDVMRNILTTASSIILGTRKEQQDALYVSDTTFFGINETADVLGIVCDGMGGLANGAEASKTAVRIVRALYAQSRPITNVGNFFVDAIGRAQAEVKALSPSGADGKKAGTTLVSAIIQNDKLYTAAVGDSRIYIIRNGQIRMLTRDHNYYLLLKEQVKKGEITVQEMNMSSQKEALISYLGIPELKLADIMSSPLQLIDGDVVLLCSDGLTKSLTKEEICNIIIENADKLQQCADMLTAAAQRKSPRGLDNTSVILLKYN